MAIIIDGKKYSCAKCIKGHRTSSCPHAERPLFEIKKKGRPVTQCLNCRALRKNENVHIKCVCSQKVKGKYDGVNVEPLEYGGNITPVKNQEDADANIYKVKTEPLMTVNVQPRTFRRASSHPHPYNKRKATNVRGIRGTSCHSLGDDKETNRLWNILYGEQYQFEAIEMAASQIYSTNQLTEITTGTTFVWNDFEISEGIIQTYSTNQLDNTGSQEANGNEGGTTKTLMQAQARTPTPTPGPSPLWGVRSPSWGISSPSWIVYSPSNHMDSPFAVDSYVKATTEDLFCGVFAGDEQN